MSKFCPSCGTETNDAKFCPNCGKPLSEVSGTEAPVLKTPPLHQQQMPVKKRRGCLIPIIGFIVVAVLIAVASGGLRGGNNRDAPGAARSPEETKQAADEFDQKVWENTAQIIKSYNEMLGGMSSYSHGNVSAVDLYNYCNEFSKALAEYNFPSSSNENEKAYVDSCTQYKLNAQMVAESLSKYLNDSYVENLSKLQESIDAATQSVAVVANNRGVFLVAAGFSDEEIKAKVDAIEDIS